MDSYQNFNFSNATFLAERFRFIQDCVKTRCILAECYLADQKYHQAYEILKDLNGTRAKFLFAKACYHTNKLTEGENILLNQDRNNRQNCFSKKILDQVINDSQGLFLLGQIKEKQQLFKEAFEAYLKAFKKNPLLFQALENLLKVFQKTDQKNLDKIMKIYEEYNQSDLQGIETQHTIFRSFNEFVNLQKENTILQDYSIKKSVQENKNKKFSTKKPQSFSIKVQEIQKFTKKKSPSKKKLQKSSSNRVYQNQNKFNIYDILKSLAEPLIQFNQAQHRQSLDTYNKLPQILKNDSWVYLQIGKCYTEFSDHKNAEIYFKKSFKLDPIQIKGLEYYSSCLWHLKKQTELTKIAQQCLVQHYFQPESWITLANCYSLNQDHDAAIKFLARAIQIDPRNAYAYCMTGHEFSSKENYDQARKYYRQAIEIDNKNVRAYWGLGNLSLKTEHYKDAIKNFTRAIKFNNDTPTVYTQLAIAYLNLDNLVDALKAIKSAEKLSPKDAFNRYHKAQILFRLQQLDEAENVCKDLLKDYQKEPQIYILLAQIQQENNKKSDAHQALLQAQTLDQRNQQKIKQMIESLNPN